MAKAEVWRQVIVVVQIIGDGGENSGDGEKGKESRKIMEEE